MSFEQKLSMGMQGRMPNLDVFLILEDGQTVAVESKFTEWMGKKSKKDLFAESYFKDGIKRWEDVGLPNCQKLAEKLNDNPAEYKYLNAAQLLKHALGLANMHTNKAQLNYLYHDFDIHNSGIRQDHEQEIKNFRNALTGELNFRAITYQQMFRYMKQNDSDIDKEYISYLEERYFSI